MIKSLGNTLRVDDFPVFVEMINNYGISLAWDGHSISTKGITLFRGRGFDKNYECTQRYMDIIDIQKKLHEVDELQELLSIEKGQDVFNMIERLYSELKAMRQLILSPDKSSHLVHKGLYTLVL